MNEHKERISWIIGVAFTLAGVNHFVNPKPYISIMPPYLPYHRELVYLSGLFEILGGIGMFFPRLRRLAGWGLILLLIAVYPANVHMALNPDKFYKIPKWALYLRLPLQFVLIALVYWSINKQDDSIVRG